VHHSATTGRPRARARMKHEVSDSLKSDRDL
jgi:hypothetical protein